MYPQLNRLNSLITNPQGPFANRQPPGPIAEAIWYAGPRHLHASFPRSMRGLDGAGPITALGTVLTLSRKRGLGDTVLTCGHPRLPCPNPLLATLKGSHPGDLPGLVAATVPETVRGNVSHSSVGEDSETDSLFGS